MRFYLWLAACLFAIGLRALDRGKFLEIYFFDVGQGDSALVWLPDGKSLLVDAGGGYGAWDAGTRLRMELARLGLTKLTAAVLTHPDQDHGFGFRGIFDGIAVEEMWVNSAFVSQTPRKPLMEDLLRWANAGGTRVREFSREEVFQMGGAEVSALPVSIPDAAANNQPLLLFVRYGGRRVFFSADMEREVEALLPKSETGSLTILKVPHHGSKTSSTPEFLRWASPQWSIISSGIGNHYGHPHLGVVTRYSAMHSNILRTDFHGYVRFRLYENGKVSCETSLGSCGSLPAL